MKHPEEIQQHEVVERSLPSLGAGTHVVTVQAVSEGTARKATATIPAHERPAKRRGNAAAPPANAQRLALRTIDGDDDGAIAI